KVRFYGNTPNQFSQNKYFIYLFRKLAKKRTLISVKRQGVTIGIRARFCVSEKFLRVGIFSENLNRLADASPTTGKFRIFFMCSIMLNFFNDQMLPRREPDHPVLPQATVVAQFRDYHTEKFSGQGDPRIVDEWIKGLELIFEVMDCHDRYRVICAQLQLTGDARLWWNAYWSMRPGEKAGCTWDKLKELIREKYYPTYYRAKMERQFLSLKQGSRSVDEYEREFTRLAAFVPDLVRTEAQRAQRFIDGLYPAVRHNIV
ncbi:Unknown protein, partial [Striga hermonthica]